MQFSLKMLYLSLLNRKYQLDCKECLKDKFADFQPALYFYNVHYFFMHSDLPVYLSDKVRWMAHNAKSFEGSRAFVKTTDCIYSFFYPHLHSQIEPSEAWVFKLPTFLAHSPLSMFVLVM